MEIPGLKICTLVTLELEIVKNPAASFLLDFILPHLIGLYLDKMRVQMGQ